MQIIIQIFGLVGVLILILVVIIRTKKQLPNELIAELERNLQASLNDNVNIQQQNVLLKKENEDLKVDKRTIENSIVQLRSEKQVIDKQLEQTKQSLQEVKTQLSVLNIKEGDRDKELERRLAELDKVRETLKAEQIRVGEEEKNKKANEEEKRDRIWSEFEKVAVSHMKSICTKTDLLLPHFTNNSLPNDWDNKIKPDFVLELLNQYVIFDAKAKNKDSSNFDSYIKTQVVSTVRKVKNSTIDFYKIIFFVVPSIGIEEIKETSFLENGYIVYVISLEVFEPIVRVLKKLEDYDLADKYDPQERENIIQLIASFNSHIRQQNATNLVMTARGIQVINDSASIPEDVWDSIEERTKKIKSTAVTKKYLDGLIHDPIKQIEEISKLVHAKAEVGLEEIVDATVDIEKN